MSTGMKRVPSGKKVVWGTLVMDTRVTIEAAIEKEAEK